MLEAIQQCGAEAVGIVSLIAFLIGVILAFMGAVQLSQFGASIYVADLVGIGMVRQHSRNLTRRAMATSVARSQVMNAEAAITVRNMTMAYGSFVLMRDLNFVVHPGDIFIVMGGSGCGKSTVLRHPIGLKEPAAGEIAYGDTNFTHASPEVRERLLRRFGILYQSGALWSSMTLAENVGLPLGEFSDLRPAQIRDIAALKLALVGLKGFEDFYPNQISGGMQKRSGIARAMALDPDILFFDEPSAGLDPISSRLLDN